jgi:hypothetical protein
MELNETLAKIDLNLDSSLKKVEKQATEMLNQELKIDVSSQVRGRKAFEFIIKSKDLC